MIVRTGAAAFAVVVSLLLLCLLVWKVQDRPLDTGAIQNQRIALRDLQEAFTDVDTALRDLRVERSVEFAALDQSLAGWEQALQAWQSNAAGASAERAAILDAASPIPALVQEFQQQQVQALESFSGFQAATESWLADARRHQGSGPSSSITQLAEELARYSLLGQADAYNRSLQLINGLPQQALALASAAAEALNSSRDLLSVHQRWEQLQIAEVLQEQDASMAQALATQEQNTRVYSIALAAYAGALLAVFGFIAWRLRRSFRALDDINANLEKLVEARTAELNQALKELKLQQAQLIQSEKMASLGQMVAGVAHEINTPLGYSLSNVETIKESLGMVRDAGGLSEDAGERLEEADVLLEDAMHGLGQIEELVHSLKNFSRMDRAHTEKANLNDGLDSALKICQNTLKDRIQIEKDYQADLPSIPCAPSQLNQVFLNLINNAGQAIEGPGSIHLSTRLEGEQVAVRIRDSGCGMDEDTRSHIFEPFFTTKKVGEGTGLGLSIVFRIIEDHGGRIDVESAPGAGTEFCIRLPLVSPKAAPALIDDETELAEAVHA